MTPEKIAECGDMMVNAVKTYVADANNKLLARLAATEARCAELEKRINDTERAAQVNSAHLSRLESKYQRERQ